MKSRSFTSATVRGISSRRRHTVWISMNSDKIVNGGMAEWLKAAVLKTVDGETRPGVRIPLPPPIINELQAIAKTAKIGACKQMQASGLLRE
jgi:hypothetical protein